MQQESGQQYVNVPQLSLQDDNMAEGDLGYGIGRRQAGYKNNWSRSWCKGDCAKTATPTRCPKGSCACSNEPFSWTPCSGMYAEFRQELYGEKPSVRQRDGESGSSSVESNEELRRSLKEVNEEVELLRSELEVTHRHLQAKHEALRILQGQTILDKATSHTKILHQKWEERNKALEKEVSGLQWEITFNQVQFKNVEHSWEIKYERICAENEALNKTLEGKNQELQELRTENSSLSQQRLELLAMLSVQERRDFRQTHPPSIQSGGSALELAVFGACQCPPSVREPCPCAWRAAASRKQVLALTHEADVLRRRVDEAFVMADAFRIAFEQQLRRGSENVLRLAEGDKQKPPERGKHGCLSLSQKLKGLLSSTVEAKIQDNPADTLHALVDLLSDKEEALAHQRKVCYMLARSSEELEKQLQTQLEGLDGIHTRMNTQKNIDRNERSGTNTTGKICIDAETDTHLVTQNTIAQEGANTHTLIGIITETNVHTNTDSNSNVDRNFHVHTDRGPASSQVFQDASRTPK